MYNLNTQINTILVIMYYNSYAGSQHNGGIGVWT